MKVKWYSFWIRLAYFLRLRGVFNNLQRWLKGEHDAPRSPLLRFDTPDELRRYVHERFVYRLDQARVGGIAFPLDWITEAEVFQARLENRSNIDGDCDDYHNWFARCLQTMTGVSKVYLLSLGYVGGGHTVCVYKYGKNWFLCDYKIYPLNDPNNAPMKVAARRTKDKDDPSVSFFVFESIDPEFRAVAIGPNDRVPT